MLFQAPSETKSAGLRQWTKGFIRGLNPGPADLQSDCLPTNIINEVSTRHSQQKEYLFCDI